MKRSCFALIVCLGAAPALAADYTVRCDLGPPGIANYSLYVTSTGVPHTGCSAGCAATNGAGAQEQFTCTFSVIAGEQDAWKCGDAPSTRNIPPYSNPSLLFSGDPCP
jgi:hypothetical protein